MTYLDREHRRYQQPPAYAGWFCAVVLSAPWFLILAVAGGFTTTAVVTAPADAPAAAPLEDFALDSDFARIGNALVGIPDFTGNPRWELHEVKAANIGGPGDRQKSRWHSFEDALPERKIDDHDYWHIDKSRGHLNPAADESQSQESIDATHNFANAVPQDQDFNAGSWERAEDRPRKIVLLAKKLKIKCRVVEINIPLYCPGKKHLSGGALVWDVPLVAHGPNFVFEPTHLAKILYVEWGGKLWTECYLFENSFKVARDDIMDHVTTIDAVERFCNRDIFRKIKAVKAGQEASDAKPPTLEELAVK